MSGFILNKGEKVKLKGVFLPIITPFYNDLIDYSSYKRLIEYYIKKGITGIIANGTTGESSTINYNEFEELLDKTVEYNQDKVKIFYGVGGNNTHEIIEKLKIVNKYKIDGILSVCPYYNRPSQEGIFNHFLKISESTDLNIIIYNIPYRTGVNIENDTVYKLSELKNIIGIKDSCGNMKQTMDLIFNRSLDFSVLTGEDNIYYLNLSLGGDGGILACAHIQTEEYISIYDQFMQNNHQGALKCWRKVVNFIPLFFEESNPAPVKYILKKQNLIKSDKVRLPLTGISNKLKGKIDKILIS